MHSTKDCSDSQTDCVPPPWTSLQGVLPETPAAAVLMLQGNISEAQTQQKSIELELDRDYVRHLVCERNEV